MRRVAEIIHIVPEEREAFLEKHLHPTEEVSRFLWIHGIRNQFYFMLNDLILMTFEYVGHEFYKDMEALAAYPEVGSHLIRKRRKDVPLEERATTNWWAPLKKLGSIVTENPMPQDEDEEMSLEEQYRSMLSGYMSEGTVDNDIAFDEDDWSESIHI